MNESYLPLSYLNHLVYCPRRFWYMHVQGEIAINAHMLEGTLQHQRADTVGHETDDKGRMVQRRVWVWSDHLKIAGFADFIEQTEAGFIPVEYKHGKKGKWGNDQVQLCAQALCLEEMMQQQPIPHGEIFYWGSRRRIQVPFTEPLRQQTKQAVQQAHQLLLQNRLPAPVTERKKCKHCSIQPICLPDELEVLAQWPN